MYIYIYIYTYIYIYIYIYISTWCTINPGVNRPSLVAPPSEDIALGETWETKRLTISLGKPSCSWGMQRVYHGDMMGYDGICNSL